MDKTIEIIVVAMVALVTGLAVLYLATGEAEGFGNFADQRATDAQCSYYEEKISRSCQDKKQSLIDQAPEKCKDELQSVQPDACEDQDTSSTSSDDSGSEDSTTSGGGGQESFTQE